MKNYLETIQYLYNLLPVFHREGAKAYKPGLENIYKVLEHLGNPHLKLKCIHVGGTNGKGSSSHLIASILQESGYKVGLYTSPHLKNFNERIRVNGIAISEEKVIQFVAQNQSFIELLKPSFFELTVGLAFLHFSEEQVNYAVIEVGLGGRLDSTNVIDPILSLITNISFDHTDILGDTLEKIAFEKAGIIKYNRPVVISEKKAETSLVFQHKAIEMNAPIFFAEDVFVVVQDSENQVVLKNLITQEQQTFISPLIGTHQVRNLMGVLTSVSVLQKSITNITPQSISLGIQNVLLNTKLKGRWQILNQSPLVICDTGHNEAGILEVVKNINKINPVRLNMILGISKDKDLDKIFELLPKNARLFFCQVESPRLKNPVELLNFAIKKGFVAEIAGNVNDVIKNLSDVAQKNELIFIGGSNFVVAEINNL